MNRTKNVKKEERKMSKGKKVKVVIEGIILLFIVYCVVLKMLPVSTGRLSTYEEINDAVATAASRYKNTVTLKTTGEPYMDYQSVLDKLMEKNMYAGGEFYAFSYVYTPDSISGKEKNTDRKSNKKTSPQVISLPEVKPINTHNYNPIF